MKKLFNIFLKFFPILIMGSILFISAFMFNANRIQTYERIRNLKESQVQIIANQVDLGTSLDPQFTSDPDNVKIVQKAVESINEQAGVYCYLFDRDCNLISNFSKTQKHTTGEAIMKELKGDNLKILSSHEYHGYISVKTEKGEEFLIYWQGVPSGDRNNCDFFIILTVAENEIQENEAINSCKAMIGILTILLGISLYANLYVKPCFTDENKK